MKKLEVTCSQVAKEVGKRNQSQKKTRERLGSQSSSEAKDRKRKKGIYIALHSYIDHILELKKSSIGPLASFFFFFKNVVKPLALRLRY